MESLESEGRPGTVADQALEAGSVMALDTDAGVEAKTTTVIPGEHILGFVGLEEAVAPEPSDPDDGRAERPRRGPRDHQTKRS